MDLVKLRIPTGKLEGMVDLSVSPDLAKEWELIWAAQFAKIEWLWFLLHLIRRQTTAEY
jgi:hypothetical protein